MIVRGVVIISLLSVLGCIIYFPSAVEPQAFYSSIYTEMSRGAQYWGEAHVTTTVKRMLEWDRSAKKAVSAPQRPKRTVESAVSRQMHRTTDGIRQRLSNIQYLRSLEALWLLASFRLSALVSWLPAFGISLLAFISDGLVRRGIKSKEFIQHSPELFAVSACVVIVLLCVVSVALVVPFPLHPVVIPVLLTMITLLVGTAVANYHKNA